MTIMKIASRRIAGLLVSFLIAALFGGAVMAKELKLADFLPPTHPYQKQVYGVLGDKISKATNGEITLKVFPAGALGGNPLEQYNRALNGVADITFGLPGYTASKFPMTLMSELPGVLNEVTATDKVWENINLIKDEHKRVHLFSIWTNAENVLYSRVKEVRSLADVKGMKIRVPSRNAGLIVKSWGAVPVSMPVPEIYNAMQTGVIDGVLIDSTATYAFKLAEVANYVITGMHASISPLALFMNRETYQSLSDAHKMAFDKIGREIATIANGVQLAGTARGEAMFKKLDGKEWIELAPEQARAFNDAAAGVIKEVVGAAEAKGLKARALVEALSK